ncbi:Hypothetical predicted protein [Mytilus galloprovincialis]|uniref:Uncharacterized protein n=2 Tax=Mytilus galloprovincialis TaxID=29158 RepID=A0A8B6CXP8_MYTGA|nr:Hypothetical predicted protein [Mytilus galloprovincialis]
MNNKLLIADFNSNGLILQNMDGTREDRFNLSSKPFNLTVIDKEHVGITYSDNNVSTDRIAILNTITKKEEKYGKCIITPEGIACNNDDVYVLSMDNRLDVMRKEGNIVRTISLPNIKRVSTLIIEDGKLFIGEPMFHARGSVTPSINCLDLDGKLIWEFNDDEGEISNPFSMALDGVGNVYVCDVYAHIVVVISPDGKHYRKLLSEADGMQSPIRVMWDKRSDFLLVCNENGEIIFYDIE